MAAAAQKSIFRSTEAGIRLFHPTVSALSSRDAPKGWICTTKAPISQLAKYAKGAAVNNAHIRRN